MIAILAESYDSNGSMLTSVNGAGTTNYTWDYENRLSKMTLPNATYDTFAYDPFGRRADRISTINTNLSFGYVYDGANMLAMYRTSDGSLARRVASGPGTDEWLGMQTGSLKYFELQDGLGSTTTVTSSTGAVDNTYGYGAFGNTTLSSGPDYNPFGFTGRESDSEIGLHYYRARFYDQNTGRFISEDPIGFKGGVNFYAYAHNNPVSLTDPLGLTAGEVTLGGCLIGGPWGCAGGALVEALEDLAVVAGGGALVGELVGVLKHHSEQAKQKCSNNGCKPCVPPVGTVAYDLQLTGRPHNRVPTPHWHASVMEQSPAPSCQCFWRPIADNQGGFGGGNTPPGTVPIGPPGGGGVQ